MGIRVIDTLESMGDFAVAQAKDIVFEDKENLQDKNK